MLLSFFCFEKFLSKGLCREEKFIAAINCLHSFFDHSRTNILSPDVSTPDTIASAICIKKTYAPGETPPLDRAVLEVMLGTVPDFVDFHIHLPIFPWQLRCFVERIIRKRLPDYFIHKSAIVRSSANSSCVCHHG